MVQVSVTCTCTPRVDRFWYFVGQGEHVDALLAMLRDVTLLFGNDDEYVALAKTLSFVTSQSIGVCVCGC
jgi:hypothetical protein